MIYYILQYVALFVDRLFENLKHFGKIIENSFQLFVKISPQHCRGPDNSYFCRYTTVNPSDALPCISAVYPIGTSGEMS